MNAPARPVKRFKGPAFAIERVSPTRDVEALISPRPNSEWHEDIGPVLWYAFPICEPPYVGTPIDCDWPGYHTHWTPLPDVIEPPMRIRLRRSRGYRLPSGSINVARPTRWGNPVRAGMFKGYTAADAVRDYRRWIERDPATFSFTAGTGREAPTEEQIRIFLGGQNLACWCRLCERHQKGRALGDPCAECDPCHVDVLLEIANG